MFQPENGGNQPPPVDGGGDTSSDEDDDIAPTSVFRPGVEIAASPGTTVSTAVLEGGGEQSNGSTTPELVDDQGGEQQQQQQQQLGNGHEVSEVKQDDEEVIVGAVNVIEADPPAAIAADSVATTPADVAPAAAPAAIPTVTTAAAVVPYLCGTLSHDPILKSIVIKGRWGFSKADFESNDPSKVSPFELKYLGSVEEALAGGGGGGGLAQPPSGPFKGTISVKQEGRPHLRVAENDVSLTFTATGGGQYSVKGTGYNKFGRFLFEGSADQPETSTTGGPRGFEVKLLKSYTGEPAPAAAGKGGGGSSNLNRPKVEKKKKKPTTPVASAEGSGSSSSSSSSNSASVVNTSCADAQRWPVLACSWVTSGAGGGGSFGGAASGEVGQGGTVFLLPIAALPLTRAVVAQAAAQAFLRPHHHDGHRHRPRHRHHHQHHDGTTAAAAAAAALDAGEGVLGSDGGGGSGGGVSGSGVESSGDIEGDQGGVAEEASVEAPWGHLRGMALRKRVHDLEKGIITDQFNLPSKGKWGRAQHHHLSEKNDGASSSAGRPPEEEKEEADLEEDTEEVVLQFLGGC